MPNKIYNRAAAIHYARQHWNKVCSDNAVGTQSKPYVKVPPDTKFEPSGDLRDIAVSDGRVVISAEELEDCTHFVSCCLGRVSDATAGGGLALPWRYGGAAIYGYLNPSDLVKGIAWGGRFASIVKRERLTWEEANEQINPAAGAPQVFEAGDVIAYFKQAAHVYSHAALYLGNGKIACHTSCRSDTGNGWEQRQETIWRKTGRRDLSFNSWDLERPHNDYRFTLMHITA